MIQANAHLHARETWIRAVRAMVRAPRARVELRPGHARPRLLGAPGYFTTPSGKTIVRHPNAYGWRTVYHCSTERIEVGAAYVPPARVLERAARTRPARPTRAELRREWYATGPGALATTRLGMRAAAFAWRIRGCDEGARACIEAANAIDGAEHWTQALAGALEIAHWIDTLADEYANAALAEVLR